VYRPDVGYVQGMSYLAAVLLLYNDVYTTFQCFCNLLNNHFFLSMFKMDIKQILRHIKIYDLLFAYNLPNLHVRFKSLLISHEQYLLDWFLTVFSKCAPIPITSRIWDMYFLEGEVFLYKCALGILKLHKNFLLTAPFEECVMNLRKLATDVPEKNLFASIKRITVPTEVHQILQKLQNL